MQLYEYSLKNRCPEIIEQFKQYLAGTDPLEHKHRVKRAALRLIRNGAVRVVKA